MVNMPASSMTQQQQWLQHTEEEFQAQRLKLVQWQSLATQQLKQQHAGQIDQLKAKQKQVGTFTQDDCRQQLRHLHYHQELARQQQLLTHKTQLKELKRQQQAYIMQTQLQQLDKERARLGE